MTSGIKGDITAKNRDTHQDQVQRTPNARLGLVRHIVHAGISTLMRKTPDMLPDDRHNMSTQHSRRRLHINQHSTQDTTGKAGTIQDLPNITAKPQLKGTGTEVLLSIDSAKQWDQDRCSHKAEEDVHHRTDIYTSIDRLNHTDRKYHKKQNERDEMTRREACREEDQSQDHKCQGQVCNHPPQAVPIHHSNH